MLFGLNNVGATYQRTLTVIFRETLHDCIEHYVDEIIMKSQEVSQHMVIWEKSLRCRRYNLRMNPFKSAFGVSSGKFLGVVHWKGIDLDMANANAVQDMKLPKTVKQLKSFTERVSYVWNFILASAKLVKTISKDIEERCILQMGQEAVSILSESHDVRSSPHTMISPMKGLLLTL